MIQICFCFIALKLYYFDNLNSLASSISQTIVEYYQMIENNQPVTFSQ